MRRAKDFRETAWNILRGRYWWAVLAALIAIILGGYAGQSPIGYRFVTNLNHASQQVHQVFDGQINPQVVTTFVRPIIGLAAAMGSLAFVYAVGLFIVGSSVELGFDLFNISLYESKSAPKIDTLFSRFSIFGNALLLRFLMALKIFLWALLLIVPGIVAAYRYAMAPYLLAEHPELSATEAIEKSKQMMAGNKGRLFCLQLSFIGWFLLSALTGGIGYFFLAPYVKAAETAFYLDLTGRLPLPVAVTPAAPGSGETRVDGRELI
ncbi:MAG: DUF975 family protein [Clostridiales bacterium]|nr:DUF975 family protein [Clostridiales bacterium]